MLGLADPLYPSDEVLAMLCDIPGVQSWCLDENYQPSQPSASLHEPLACLTPDVKISGRQWLVQAPPTAKVSLQSGLMRVGRRCLYESNQANAESRGRRWRRSGSLPPGWWHSQRHPKLYQEPLVLLSTHNNPNYFHWLTQPGLAPLFLQDHFGLRSLPKLALALSYRPRTSVPLYVPSVLDVFAPELPLVRGLALSSDSVCRFAVQEHRSEVMVSPSQLHWLKNRCRDHLQFSPKPWRRVLISRQRSRRRRCLNENQVLATLAPYGFECYCLEDLSVSEQLRLFAESVLLVGVHGAGFSNLVASSSLTSVIELIPKPGAFSHYYIVADVLGLKHGHLLASSCDKNTDDFTINTGDLLELLREMELL